MPYRWTDPDTLTLWPHNPLRPRGFVWAIALPSAFFALPVLTQLGHTTLWPLLAILLGTVTLLWLALRRNLADRAITETLTLTPETLTLVRQARRRQSWQANPHWVRLTLYETGGPVPLYLTLTGNGREVELGAFLTPDERRNLRHELDRRLAGLR